LGNSFVVSGAADLGNLKRSDARPLPKADGILRGLAKPGVTRVKIVVP
jgi:hypothetical protein